MSMQPQPLPPVPEDTAAVARAAFPKATFISRSGIPSTASTRTKPLPPSFREEDSLLNLRLCRKKPTFLKSLAKSGV